MESRLPKPKIIITSATPQNFINMNNRIVMKKKDDLPHTSSNSIMVRLNEAESTTRNNPESKDEDNTRDLPLKNTNNTVGKLTKAKSTLNMHSKSENKNQNDAAQSSSNGFSDKLKKSKSTHNINLKTANENKPPPKQNLVRSKTVLSMTTVSRATKRPAVTAVHGDVKKAFTKPSAKPISTHKTGNQLSCISGKSVVNATSKKPQTTVPLAKPSKWDLKGRLAYTNEELSNLRQQFKDLTAKHTELEEQANTSKSNEDLYRRRAEKFEASTRMLDTEIQKLREKIKNVEEEMDKVEHERDDLKKRLKELEELYKNSSTTLKESEIKCALQETALLEYKAEVEKLKHNLEVQTKNNDELQSLAHKMDKDRRILHNTIQEMKGNIRVFCRVRPRTASEGGKPLCAIHVIDENTIEVGRSDGSDGMSCSGKSRGARQEFTFDKVFLPTAKQEDVFEELALLVQSAIEGYNVCVFAYGQTGSGKTFTMEGMPGIEMEGMIPRTVRHIFQEMKQFERMGWEYQIEASFLEIYNEHIVDLLDSQPKSHEIRMVDSKGQDLYVSNLQIEEIHSPEELHECLVTAQRNRAVAATSSNERSSRSHSVTRIRLIGTHQSKQEVSIGNLNLVDLAGSERLKGEELVRMTETKNINKSLANLGNVILALLKRQEHVPYRNSKLTHLLQPSLGGNSKTLMLLNISPLDECYNETLNSLRFGSNVNNCKTGNVKRARTFLQSES